MVQLIFPAVLIQNLAIVVFSDIGFSAKLNARKKIAGKYVDKRQPTDNKQVEMFLKLTCNVDISGDDVLLRLIAMSRRAFLEMMNSL